MYNQIETEVKILLQTEENKDKFLQYLSSVGVLTESKTSNKESQLNHYFIDTKNIRSADLIVTVMSKIDTRLKNIAKKNSLFAMFKYDNLSFRTRYIDNKQAILVVKGSNTDASNGQSRGEWEHNFGKFYVKDCKLDKLLLSCGLDSQSKWSRERESHYLANVLRQPIKVDIDKNAGYGWLVELELLADNQVDADNNLKLLTDFVAQSPFEILDSSKLDRMFQFYNQNWKDYYGTDKTFEIEYIYY